MIKLKRIALFILPIIAILGSTKTVLLGPYNGINVGAAIVPAVIAGVGLTRLHAEMGVAVGLMGLMIIISHVLSGVTAGGVQVELIGIAFLAASMSTAVAKNPVIMAYVIGTLGLLIGADFLSYMAVPPGSTEVFGGAGIDDAVLLVGPLAAVIATVEKTWL